MNPLYRFKLSYPANTDNILNPGAEITPGYLVNGFIEEHAGYKTTDYIPVTPNTDYYCLKNSMSTQDWFALCFYSADKTPILELQIDHEAQSPQDAWYVRISFSASADLSHIFFGLRGKPFSYYGVAVVDDIKPLWGADLAKEYSLQSNERFYRAALSGNLQFTGPDYDTINGQPFETPFTLTIEKSKDGGATFQQYWVGRFYKTDCKFDSDTKIVEVTPESVDNYTDVLGGMEKEYDLIKLCPEIENIYISKRPLIQLYIPGQTVISCFLSGNHWEQDCEAVSDEEELTDTYHFGLTKKQTIYRLTGEVNLDMLGGDSMGYTFEIFQESGMGGDYWRAELQHGDYAVWYWNGPAGGAQPTLPLNLTADTSTSARGQVTVSDATIKVYGRLLVDVANFAGDVTFELPFEDMVPNNRNYRRCVEYGIPASVVLSEKSTTEPTQWGIIQPGVYYLPPASEFGTGYVPIGRSSWTNISIWFDITNATARNLDRIGRKTYILRDAYTLASALKMVLKEVAPDITFEATTDYSEFLYGASNPVSGLEFALYLTQKSNILAGDYSQPAQKAPITLRQIMDMLRDTFECYWFIDDGKFRIEHISWFKNGGSYGGTPVVGRDLTVESITRNGKKLAFATSQWEYDKPSMPERYQFGWMDDVTDAFNGSPIVVKSKFVQPGNIEEKRVANFTSDVDYMLLNPAGCSQDGFAILAAVQNNLAVSLTDHYFLQNTGLIVPTANAYCVTPYIEVNGHDMISNSRLNGQGVAAWVAYDESYNKTHWSNETTNYTYQDGDYYVRFCYKYDDLGGIDKVFARTRIPVLPFKQVGADGITYQLQNGYLAFVELLPLYHVDDLPSYHVIINGEIWPVSGIQRGKKQSIQFPCEDDPNIMQLIRTYVGDGQIEKISINLSSRNAQADLAFDTYE